MTGPDFSRILTGFSPRDPALAGGADPRWRRDGRELFYTSADGWLTAVAFSSDSPGAPKQLFAMHVAPSLPPYMSNYNVTPDGQRFLLKVPVRDVSSTPIHILTDWRAGRHKSSN